MTQGQVVTVFLYGGGKAVRRVVSQKPGVVVVCSEEEYQSAMREGRKPDGIGFPVEDVLEAAKESQ